MWTALVSAAPCTQSLPNPSVSWRRRRGSVRNGSSATPCFLLIFLHSWLLLNCYSAPAGVPALQWLTYRLQSLWQSLCPRLQSLRVPLPQNGLPTGHSPFRGMYTWSGMAYLQPTVHPAVSLLQCAASTGGSPFEDIAPVPWTAWQCRLPLLYSIPLLSLSVSHPFSSSVYPLTMSSPISPFVSPAPCSCHS